MKVSVVMITYAHAPFIVEAIEGVLMQKCDFEIELILANDCSPDNTDEVVKRYLDNHPKKELVRYTRHSNNIGMMGNFVWALEQCKGKYIALCEGDDYWTDPLKLKRQVDFLEKNSHYSAVSENSLVLYDDGTIEYFGIKRTRILKLSEIIRSRQFSTASLLFRKDLLEISDRTDLVAGDTPLAINLQKSGPIFYTDIVSSVYRRGKQGLTYTFNQASMCKKLLYYNFYLNRLTERKYKKIITQRIEAVCSNCYRIKNKKIKMLLKKTDNLILKIFFTLFNIKQRFYFDLDYLPSYIKIYHILKNIRKYA